MEKSDFLKALCTHLFGLTGIPSALYENGKKIFMQELFPLPDGKDLSAQYYEMLDNSDHPVSYFFSEERLLFAGVKQEDSPYRLLLGPVCTASLSDYDVQNILHLYNFKKDDFGTLKDYLFYAPVIAFRYFLQMLCFLHLIVNGKSVSPSAFLFSDNEENSAQYAFNEMFSHNEQLQYDEVERHTSFEFESKMMFCIQNGNKKDLLALYEYIPVGRTGKVAFSPLRQEKNSAICGITLATRAAISGGLSKEIAFQLSDIAIQKIEYCSTINQVNKISYDFSMEVTERVASLQYHDCSTPLIRRVIQYITEHVCCKITVDELAKLVHTNRSFLSGKFKSEIGMSLSDYINHQKIAEAKKLLHYSDKPLSTIASYLGFSSQSHFQTVFKKCTGITPFAYQKSVLRMQE